MDLRRIVAERFLRKFLEEYGPELRRQGYVWISKKVLREIYRSCKPEIPTSDFIDPRADFTEIYKILRTRFRVEIEGNGVIIIPRS